MVCSKSDWKLFNSRIVEWQEAYMEKLIKKYTVLLNGEGDASEKFWKLEERIKKDRKHPGVIMELEKQNMVFDIARLIKCRVIKMDDLEGFSEELKAQVTLILNR